jgi:hypothetical protein
MCELFLGHPSPNGGSGDFVAIQVQDGKHRAVADGIQKFIGMPTRCRGASFRFTIADYAARK